MTDLGPHLVQWNLFIDVKTKARARVLANEHNIKEEQIVDIAIDYLGAHPEIFESLGRVGKLKVWTDPEGEDYE